MNALTDMDWYRVIQSTFWILSSIGIIIAWVTFRQNSKLKRAEWLKSLFEKFYESSQYKEIRWKIDNESIQADVDGHAELEEKLVDYLNFFEFIGSLWKMKQLSISEVRMLFDYYLNIIKNSVFLRSYIAKYGFENLSRLLSAI